MRFIGFFMLLLLFTNQLDAQDKKLSILPNIGASTVFLDGGWGIHLGVNPSFEINKRFSAEGQVSYLHTRISDAFLTGETGKVNAFNALVGARFYLNSENKPTRFYVNLLTGLNYTNEINNPDDSASINGFTWGWSGGVFVDINRLVVGLSYDTPQNAIIKLGYSF